MLEKDDVPQHVTIRGIHSSQFGPYRFAWIPLPVLFVAVIGLWFKDIQAPHESAWLLIALNLLLATLPALSIAYLFARSFLVAGAPGMLLFGCGALIWSASGLSPLAASLAPGPWPNVNACVTIHNVTVWGASLCYLAGAALLQQRHRALPHSPRALVAAYALALAVAALIVLTALKEWTPVFFVQGKGGSEERQVVLGSAIVTILLTLLLVQGGSRRRPSAFLDWFILALLLLVIGYAGQMLESNIDSVLSWVSRMAQFLGGGYMLAAAYAAFRGHRAPFEVPAQSQEAQSQEEAPHRYGIAVVLVLAATVLRLVFLQVLDISAAFITFYPAVMLAAFYGGLRAGILATILSAAFADYFWMQRVGSVAAQPADWLALAIFLITGTLISWTVERLQQAQSRLHRIEVGRRTELQRMVATRGADLSLARDEAERANNAKSRLLGELQDVYDYAPVGLCMIDAQMRWTRINAELAEISGFPPEAHIGRRFHELLPQIAGIVEPVFRQVIATGEPSLRFEITGETPAHPGEIRVWEMSSWPMRDETGAVTAVNVVVQEVTERREVARALHESKQRLEGLLQSAMDAIIAIDERQRIVLFNAAAEKMFGCPASETLGSPIDRFIPKPFRQAHREHVRMFGETRATSRQMCAFGSYSGLRQNGEAFPVEASISQLQAGGEKLFTAILRDITGRKRAEEATARLAAIVTSSSDAIVSKSLDGTVMSWNEGAARLFGYRAEEMIGQPARRLIPAARQSKENLILVRVASGEEVKPYETVRLHKDGEPVDVAVTVSPIRDASGAVIGVSKIVRDITERKRHEEHAELLMREVNHRAKNMLAVVQSVARHTASTKPGDFIARFSDRIQALSTSQDLLVQNEWKGVDIAALVQSQLAHFQDLIGTRIELKGPPVLISASAAQTIGIALHELATNAGKYGALSNADGRLEIGWSLERAGGNEEAFVLYWREAGGPPVKPPGRRGFGSTVIQRMATESLEAEVDLDFAPQGLSWRLRCPAREAVEGYA